MDPAFDYEGLQCELSQVRGRWCQDVFADGHDTLAAVLRHRHESAQDWTEVAMTALVNDRWRSRFNVTKLGRHSYTIEGWVDDYRTWSTRLAKRIAAGQDIKLELEIGARLDAGSVTLDVVDCMAMTMENAAQFQPPQLVGLRRLVAGTAHWPEPPKGIVPEYLFFAELELTITGR